MKKMIFTGLVLALLVTRLAAQNNCKGYMPFEEGTQLQLTTYDDKGKMTSTSNTTIKTVKPAGEGFEATFENQTTDKKGNPLTSGNYSVRCRDGNFEVDASRLLDPNMMKGYESMQLTISGKALELPNNMSPGQQLPDGNTEVKIGMSGMTIMKITLNITNRKVEKEEAMSTPAGLFKCVKITYDIDMKVGFSRKVKAAEWYAQGVGMVRSETYNSKGAVESYTELTKFTKP